jgi:hypothetical protein
MAGIVSSCHLHGFSTIHHPVYNPSISMRKKKTSDAPVNDSFKLPAADLDPVNNDQLHEVVWNHLADRLKRTFTEETNL